MRRVYLKICKFKPRFAEIRPRDFSMTRVPVLVARMPQKVAGVPKILIGIAILDVADVAGYMGGYPSAGGRSADDPGI